ncbi:hypothetical protein SAMN04488105_13012 [Salipiger thiooxidans]|uniref:Imelysin-like domain-containing protein n=1 Tax=Salipiger thiooxidans TaxID=282683 RepID=A0A1G7M6I8_9RHOB|nr:hypothetical protein [Salipiger thiooxidans]SDF57236.1 hypothetical protein SAMN04488105_13012 [Salipiger thiooxidans]
MQLAPRDILRRGLALGAALVLAVGLSSGAARAQACDALVAQCGAAGAAPGSGTPCPELDVQLALACGAHDLVLAYAPLSGAAATEIDYFHGAAYFALYRQERARGSACELARLAGDRISRYLKEKRELFYDERSFGVAGSYERVYHATKILGLIDAQPGCVQGGFSEARLGELASGIARSYMTEVFLDTPRSVKSDFETLASDLRRFSGLASDLETGIALRAIESSSVARKLGTASDIVGELIGVPEQGGAELLDELAEDVRKGLNAANKHAAAFEDAVKETSAEDFAAARMKLLALLGRFNVISAEEIALWADLIPLAQAEGVAQEPHIFQTLAVVAETAAEATPAGDALTEIEKQWQAYGAETGLCEEPAARERVWFC